jgi:hypothetical protein
VVRVSIVSEALIGVLGRMYESLLHIRCPMYGSPTESMSSSTRSTFCRKKRRSKRHPTPSFCTTVQKDHNSPLRASSTLRASSPAANPPLLAHTMLPSLSSTLSSWSGNAHGQWCGKWTHDSVPGQR